MLPVTETKEIHFVEIPAPPNAGEIFLKVADYALDRCRDTRSPRRLLDYLLSAAESLRLASQGGLDISPEYRRFARIADRYRKIADGNGQ